MRRRFQAAALLLGAAGMAGCMGIRQAAPLAMDSRGPPTAAEQQARATLAGLYPRSTRLTHRAVLTVAGRPYPCDGYLEISPANELRLAVLTPMGVLTQVKVSSNGEVRVLSAGSSFRESWSRDYLARDARLLFAPDTAALQAGRLADGRPVLWKRQPDGTRLSYVFGPGGAPWQELEIARGSRRLYHAVCRRQAVFGGPAREVPAEIRVEAECYTVDLRLCELRASPAL